MVDKSSQPSASPSRKPAAIADHHDGSSGEESHHDLPDHQDNNGGQGNGEPNVENFEQLTLVKNPSSPLKKQGTRHLVKALSVEQRSGLMSSINNTEEYMLMDRDTGSGPRRIGLRLQLGEDLYSMFFASTLDPKYVYYHKEIQAAEEPVKPANEAKPNDAQENGSEFDNS